jgi:hypothetical protein
MVLSASSMRDASMAQKQASNTEEEIWHLSNKGQWEVATNESR